MEDSLHNKLMPGIIYRKWLYTHLLDLVAECEARVIPQDDDNVGYKLGHHFGTCDTLKTIINLLESLPDDDPSKDPPREIHGANSAIPFFMASRKR